MATIKSYTDLEQSKRLAEILPLESADMYWDYDVLNHEDYPMVMDDQFDELCTPAWSLAVLLDVLPLEIETHKQTDGYKIYYYVELYMKHMGKEIHLSTERHENLVDACYELIWKLNELKML